MDCQEERPDMKILVVYTPNFKWLFNNLKDSMSSCEELELVERCVEFKKQHSKFEFKSDSWYEAIVSQVSEAIKFIKNEVKDGEYFIISDVDIHFFQPNRIVNLIDKEKDILAVKEEIDSSINTGFIIAKKTPEIINMYEYTHEQLKKRRSNLADQDEINNYLLLNDDINLGYIDKKFAGMGNRYPIKKTNIFFHAIKAKTLVEKKRMIISAKNKYNNL